MDRRSTSVHATILLIILLFTIIARVDFMALLAHIEPVFRLTEDIAKNYDESVFQSYNHR
jgi:hypothetical protein